MSTPREATKREPGAAGIAFSAEDGGRHYKVRFTVRGQQLRVVCSRTISDRRAALNARLQVRRTIRQALSS